MQEAHRFGDDSLEFFGEDGRSETFSRLRDTPLAEITQSTFKEIGSFLAELPAPDDRTLLLV